MTDVYEKKLDETIPETVKNTAEEYDKKVAEFTESLKQIDDIDKLKEMEQDVIKEIDANSEETAKKKYKLPEQTTFRGTTYNRSKVGGYVADLLDGQEVNWQMTLGLFDIIDFWKKVANDKNNVSEIPYQLYDATLRFLGQRTYKGYETIRKVLVVSSIFSESRDEYLSDLSLTYFLANKHNAILTRMDEIEAMTHPLTPKA